MTLLEALIQLAAERAFVGGMLAWRRGRPIGPVATGGSVVGFGVAFLRPS